MGSVQQLINGYLDGELEEDEARWLASALQADPSALECFALSSFVHSHLKEWMDQQRVQDSAMRAVVARIESTPARSRHSEAAIPLSEMLCDCSELADEPGVASRQRQLWPGSIAARAALLLLAAGVAFAAYLYTSHPVIVAQLTQSTNCQWDAGQKTTRDGALLECGEELRLLKGRALITLVGGAQVLLEGPTSLRLDSASKVYLEHGRIAAKVPMPAIGFTVSTSLARFVDLGTAFTLKLDADESFDLYVFEGLVELQLDERFGEVAHQPLRVAEVRAVHFDVGSADVVALPFNQGEEMPF